MDRVRTPAKARPYKKIAAVAAGILVVVACIVGLVAVDFTTQRIERGKVTIDVVKQGLLEIKVHANGQLVPRNVEYLTSQVTGRVNKKNVRPGDAVKIGDLLAELDNPQLVASAAEAKSAWEGSVNELKASKAELRGTLINQESILMQAKFALQRAKTRLDAELSLPPGIIPRIEHEATKLNFAQSTEQYDLETKRMAAVRINVQEQFNADQSRTEELKKAMERAFDQVANLRIVAGIDGIVQEMNIDIGQQLQPGSPIGRIARPDELYAELRVSAREANDVRVGQHVVIDTRNGTVTGTVARIDPAVINGTIVVDINLTGKIPASARPQLPVEGTIYLARISDATYVGRPSYVKPNATVPVYKLDPSGDYATRVPVRVGKVSLDYMQIESGLAEGDRLITSEIGEWQGQDKILLK
jgi:HlyD family secretion protein